MKPSHSRSRSLIALGLLCSSSIVSALPLVRLPPAVSVPATVKGEMKRAPQASYSVVAVDGGSSSSSVVPATKTVTDAVTQVQTSVVLSTVIATLSASEASAVATTSVPTTVTLVQTPATSPPTTGSVQPSVTSMPYDDGQWHTTYYFRTTVAPSVPQNQAATSSPAPTPISTIDPGQWAAWSGKNGEAVP